MREAVDHAREFFLTGLPLARMVNRRLSVDLELFSRGGMCILDKIAAAGLRRALAPAQVSKVERVRLLIGAARAAWHSRRGRMISLEESYAHCRAVAKKRAKNFYYSFLLLTAERRTPCAPSTPSCATATI